MGGTTIRGVWPVLCTPFTRDGAVDPRAHAPHRALRDGFTRVRRRFSRFCQRSG